MKTNTIKKAVLSVALGAALVATVSGVTYDQKTVTAESIYNETTCEAKLNTNQRYSNISEINQEYVYSPIETFVSRAVDEDIKTINFVYNDLYSLNNEEYGYVLDFSYSIGEGFIIVSTFDDTEKLIEMDLTHGSPYREKDGKYIYGSFDSYFIAYDDGRIVRVTANGDEWDAELGNRPLKVKDKDKSGIHYPVQYNYSTGCVFKREIPNFYYNYSTGQSTKDNNCANAAGVIYLNYWNSYHNNSLLRLSTNDWVKGRYDVTYHLSESKSTYYMDLFYKYMDTNWAFGLWGGTLPGDCYKGFTKLITEQGYVARQSSVKTFNDIKTQINNNVPVFIVSDNYYFTYSSTLPTINSTQGNYSFNIDCWHTYGIENAHTFVGYGYADYTYYDSNGTSSQIHLVKIADGWGDSRYFNFDLSTTMSMAAIRVSRC